LSPRSTVPDLASSIVDLASDRKASDIVVLDLREHCSFTDYFVICSGSSKTQVRAICEHIEQGMKRHGRGAPIREGTDNGQWALLDYGDVVVHVFQPETRELYDLEKLWFEAPRWTYEQGSAIEVNRA